MSKPKINQNLSPVDFEHLENEAQELYEFLKEKITLNKYLFWRFNFIQEFEMAVHLNYRNLSYVSSNVELENGESAYYYITIEHAKALSRILNSHSFHFLDITLTTWAPDAFETFVAEIKQGTSKVEFFSLDHISGDEFSLKNAKCLADLIDFWKCSGLRIKNNEYIEGSIQLLINELKNCNNKSLNEILIFPFRDDPRGYKPILLPEVNDFLKNNRQNKTPFTEDAFNDFMMILSVEANETDLEDSISHCEAVLDTRTLEPKQMGWIAYYLHRSRYNSNNLEHFQNAIKFLCNTKNLGDVSRTNLLWMYSTAAEMSFKLQDKSSLTKFIDIYDKINLEGSPNDVTLANSLRSNLNAIIYWKNLNDKIQTQHHRTKAIELLSKHSSLADLVQVPEDIKIEAKKNAGH